MIKRAKILEIKGVRRRFLGFIGVCGVCEGRNQIFVSAEVNSHGIFYGWGFKGFW